jgi:hypothetical protein
MAKKKRVTPNPLELRRLEGLPQRFDVWQVGARQAPMEVEEEGRLVRPWMVLVASSSEGYILAHEVATTAPEPQQVWTLLAKAMAQPAAGEPHLPTSVQFDDEAICQGLEPHLEQLNVTAETMELLDHLDEVFEELNSGMEGGGVPAPPGLLEGADVTPDAVAGLFDAAAHFHERQPWKSVGERAIRVDCLSLEGGPWYAVLMGQAGMTAGLVLYDDYETLERIRTENLSPEESARITAALAVVFGTKDELADADREGLEEHGWRVAGPNAYPVVYRMDPDLDMKAPQAWEVELLEGCLRALPEFVRKKTRRLGPTPFKVLVSSGELEVVLAWAED